MRSNPVEQSCCTIIIRGQVCDFSELSSVNSETEQYKYRSKVAGIYSWLKPGQRNGWEWGYYHIFRRGAIFVFFAVEWDLRKLTRKNLWLVAIHMRVVLQTAHSLHPSDRSQLTAYRCFHDWGVMEFWIIFKATTGSSGYAFWWERTTLHSMETVVWRLPGSLKKCQSRTTYLLRYAKVPHVT